MRVLTRRRRRGKNLNAELCFSVEEFYAARLAAIARETGTTAQKLGAKILREWLLMRPMRPASSGDLTVSAASVPVSPAVFDAARAAGVAAMQDGFAAMQDGFAAIGRSPVGPGPAALNDLAREVADMSVGAALVAIARGDQ